MSVPAAAVQSNRRAPLAASVVVQANPGIVRLGGEMLGHTTAQAIRSAGELVLSLHLAGDRWQPIVGQPNEATKDLLLGISPPEHIPELLAAQYTARDLDDVPGGSPSQAYLTRHGWLEVVQPFLSSRNVVRLDDTTIEIHLPQVPPRGWRGGVVCVWWWWCMVGGRWRAERRNVERAFEV